MATALGGVVSVKQLVGDSEDRNSVRARAPASDTPLELRGDGLGKVRFGDDLELAISQITEVLGSANDDGETTCESGSDTLVFWDDLYIVGDGGAFRGWRYHPDIASLPDTPLRSESGVRIGMPLAELYALFRNDVIVSGKTTLSDEIGGEPTVEFAIQGALGKPEDHMSGSLTGDDRGGPGDGSGWRRRLHLSLITRRGRAAMTLSAYSCGAPHDIGGMLSQEQADAFSLAVPVAAPIAAILWDEQRRTASRRELANAVLDKISWETRGPIGTPFGPVESLPAARYLANLVDEVAYIIEHEHSVSVSSASQTAGRAAVPAELSDAAACVEEFGWQNARVDGAVGTGLRKVLEQGGARIAACLFRRLIDDGVVDELQSRETT